MVRNPPSCEIRRRLMKARMLTIIVAGVLAGWCLPGRAQDSQPPAPEKLPPPQEKSPEKLPPPKEKGVTAPATQPPCGERVIWMDYFVPVQTLHAPKEDFVRTEKISTFAIEMRPEERTYPTTVLRPREITREVTVCTTEPVDRKSTRLNSSHLGISYAVFCLKKKKNNTT